jgi:hypothetical protein
MMEQPSTSSAGQPEPAAGEVILANDESAEPQAKKPKHSIVSATHMIEKH